MPLPSCQLVSPEMENDLGRSEFLEWLLDKDWHKLTVWQKQFVDQNYHKKEFSPKQRAIIDDMSFTVNHTY